MEDHPKVGVAVMVLKDGKVLLGKRKGSHGSGEYAFPGGHLEYMESFADCIARELEEECGVRVLDLRFQFVSNGTMYAPKHYVHIGLIADWEGGEPEVREPDRCDGWGWYDLDALPSPLFTFAAQAIEAYRTGRTYFDALVADTRWAGH